jgi:outer membrane protein assembly factor BamB
VYAVVNGQLEARRRNDGTLLWTWAPPSGEAVAGSVIVTRNLVFARLVPAGYSTDGGRVIALDLATRKVVWAHDADGEIALGGGLLLITRRSTATVTAIAVR